MNAQYTFSVRIPLFLVLTLAGVALACTHHTTVHEAIELPYIPLDEGRTWEASASTREGLTTMVNTLNNYQPERGHKSLPDSLQAIYHHIFNTCTMTGPGHEALHIYLMPIGKHIKGMEQEAGKEEVEALKQYLVHFNTYFH